MKWQLPSSGQEVAYHVLALHVSHMKDISGNNITLILWAFVLCQKSRIALQKGSQNKSLTIKDDSKVDSNMRNTVWK